MTKAVLVAGGAGYVGAHTCKALARAGFLPVVLDNLSTGHRDFVRWGPLVQADLHDTATIADTIRRYECIAVLHFAAFALVGESVTEPAKYYDNNVVGTLSLLAGMRAAGCDALVFSSTCAIYGQPAQVPIVEDTRPDPVNPYGASKLMVERILADFRPAYGLRSIALRYFNACGADPDSEIGETARSGNPSDPARDDGAAGPYLRFRCVRHGFRDAGRHRHPRLRACRRPGGCPCRCSAAVAVWRAGRRVQPRHRARLFGEGSVGRDRARSRRTTAGRDGTAPGRRSGGAGRRPGARTQRIGLRPDAFGPRDHRSNRLGLAPPHASEAELTGQGSTSWRSQSASTRWRYAHVRHVAERRDACNGFAAA